MSQDNTYPKDFPINQPKLFSTSSSFEVSTLENPDRKVLPYSFETLVGVSPFIKFSSQPDKNSPSPSKDNMTTDLTASNLSTGLSKLIEHIEQQNKSRVQGILKDKAKSRFSIEVKVNPGKRVSLLLGNSQHAEPL